MARGLPRRRSRVQASKPPTAALFPNPSLELSLDLSLPAERTTPNPGAFEQKKKNNKAAEVQTSDCGNE